MSKEHFDAIIDLIRTLVTIAIGASAVTVMVIGWLKTLRIKFTEQSVGAAKIKEMQEFVKFHTEKAEKEAAEFQKLYKECEEECEKFRIHYKGEFEAFKKDYKELMDKFVHFLENRR